MKELVIPKDTDTEVNVANVTPYTPYLIIAYYKDNPAFYIQYCAGEWSSHTRMDLEDPIESEYTLLDLIHAMEKKEQKSFTYKVIEFNE